MPTTPEPVQPVTLVVWTSEGGSARVVETGFECVAECSTPFPMGSTVTVQPIPDPGYDFVGWDGPCVGNDGCYSRLVETCEGTGDCTVTLHEKTRVIGRFELRHRVSVTIRGEGSVRAEPRTTHEGPLVCPGDCSREFQDGLIVRLIATPVEGWRFVKWEGACDGPECHLLMSRDVEVEAVFARPGEEHPAACSALMPSELEDRVVATLPQGPCDTGTSDGAGRFALGFQQGSGPTFPRAWFFETEGDEAVRVGDVAASSDEFQLQIRPQTEGFLALSGTGLGSRTLTTYASDGRQLHAASVAASHTAGWVYVFFERNPVEDGAVIVRTYYRAHPSGAEWVNTFQRYAASGEAVGAETDIARDVRVIEMGVTTDGRVLVIADTRPDGDPEYAFRWLSSSGVATSEWKPLPERLNDAFALETLSALQPLADGSLVLTARRRSDRAPQFAATFTGEEVASVPQWLQARPLARLFPIKDGQGYAVTRGAACGDMVEVVTAAGESCGCVHAEHLGPRTTVGLDGSMIVPVPGPYLSSEQCRYELYPGLFR